MIGLRRGTVSLSAHHEEWAALFEKEKETLYSALKDFHIDIEHVGSTAIPGVMAKPIIDIMLGVSGDVDFDMIAGMLKKHGYEDRGERGISERRLLVKGPEEKRTHYLHIEIVEKWLPVRSSDVSSEIADADSRNIRDISRVEEAIAAETAPR